MNGILCADMDNTIIYSYKRNIGENKLNVELYNGREISFISEKTHDLLKKVSEKMTIIPTSTRTEEQYKRIDLDIGIVPYALVCNGGVLLVNGKRDREWYLESLRMIRNSIPEMAVRRLRKRLQPAYIIAAGDSEFDVSMVEESDLGLVPAGFKKIYGNGSDRFKETVMEMEAGRLFSETLLEKCLVLYFKEPD